MYAELIAREEQLLSELKQIQDEKAQAKEDAINEMVNDLNKQIKEAELASELQVVRIKHGKAKKTRKAATVNPYVNPDDPSQTYTRGPKPGWLVARLDAYDINAGEKNWRALLE